MLDPKEQILEIILTEQGRKLLAQNKFEVKYYAFGDDDIDYQVPPDVPTIPYTGSYVLAFEDGSFAIALEDGTFTITTF